MKIGSKVGYDRLVAMEIECNYPPCWRRREFYRTKALRNLGKSNYYYGIGIQPDLYVVPIVGDTAVGWDVAPKRTVNINKEREYGL